MGKEALEGRRNVAKGYTFHNLDESDPAYYYYGFMNSSGDWMIMRLKSDSTEAKYIFGVSTETTYDNAWTNRTSHTYENIVE